MSEQGDKLIQTLRFAVREMDNAKQFTKRFQELGRRHATYEVQKSQYAFMGDPLLSSLSQVLGDRFTEPIQQAWAEFYEAMAPIMIAAAASDRESWVTGH